MSFLSDIFSFLGNEILGVVETPYNWYEDAEHGDWGQLVESVAETAADVATDGATAPLFAAVNLGQDISSGASIETDAGAVIGGVAGGYSAYDGAETGDVSGVAGDAADSAASGASNFADAVFSGNFDQVAGLAGDNISNTVSNAFDNVTNAPSNFADFIGNIPSELTASIDDIGSTISSAGDWLSGNTNLDKSVGENLDAAGTAAVNNYLTSQPSGIIDLSGQMTDSSADIFNQNSPDTAEGVHYIGAPVTIEQNGMETAGVAQEFDPSKSGTATVVPYSTFEQNLDAGGYSSVAGEQGFSNLVNEENALETQAQSFDATQTATEQSLADAAQAQYLSTVTPNSGTSNFVEGSTGNDVVAGSNTAATYSVPASLPGQVAAANAASVPIGGAGGAAGTPSFLSGQGEDIGEGGISGLGTGQNDTSGQLPGNNIQGITNSSGAVATDTSAAPPAPDVNEIGGGGNSVISPSGQNLGAPSSANINIGSNSTPNFGGSILNPGGQTAPSPGTFGTEDLGNTASNAYNDFVTGAGKMADDSSGGLSGILQAVQPYAQTASLLGGLGSAAYGLVKGNSNPPETYQTNAISQEQENISGIEEGQGQQLINEFNTGTLPTGESNIVGSDVNAAIQKIKSEYAGMGLSGSTMEQEAIQSAQLQGANETASLLQNLNSEGLQYLSSASGALTDAQNGYSSIAKLETDDDNALNSSLSNFAKTLGLVGNDESEAEPDS